jgi:hypothetical protein
VKIRSEPFLWIHLVGIALFPVLSQIALMGLAVGDSYSYLIELPLLVAIAILPILFMQLSRPFDIFSVLFLSLRPESLTEEQRKILSLFKTASPKIWSLITALVMLLFLWLMYHLSPLATGIEGFLPQWRILGLGIAAIAFLGSNLFLQIPLSVLQVLLTKESKLTQIEPYPREKIVQDFTVPGIKVNKILWFIQPSSEVKEIVKLR